MVKKKLVSQSLPDELTHPLSLHFDLLQYDAAVNYRPQEHVFWVDYLDCNVVPYSQNQSVSWVDCYRNQGFKIIVDHLSDSYVTEPALTLDNVLVLRAQHWVWISEYLQCIQRNYQSQLQSSNPTQFFLLLMNLQRDTRDQLYSAVAPFLSDSKYSYVGRGIVLDNEPLNARGFIKDDRHFDPVWYASTNFSLVSETTTEIMRPIEWTPSKDQRLFISEKSFKPLAFKHPAMVWGCPGTLAYLKSLGFVTWDHVIDETYDTIHNHALRLEAIVAELNTLHHKYQQGPLFADTETQQRLEHNYHHFYNQHLVSKMLQEEIIDTISNFIEQ